MNTSKLVPITQTELIAAEKIHQASLMAWKATVIENRLQSTVVDKQLPIDQNEVDALARVIETDSKKIPSIKSDKKLCRVTYAQRQKKLKKDRSFIPYSLNPDNVTPLRSKHAGNNPLYDAHQIVHDRKALVNTKVTPTYSNALQQLAVTIANAHIRQASIECNHLFNEFIDEAKGAINDHLGKHPEGNRLIEQLVYAVFNNRICSTIGGMSKSEYKELHQVARRACDARMRRLKKTKQMDPSFFDLIIDDRGENKPELNAMFVNARIDFLATLVREQAALGGYEARSAKAHLNLLEEARAYFHASIHGELVEVPSAGLVPKTHTVGVNTFTARFGGCQVLKVKTPVKGELKTPRLANSALYMRLLRLARFVRQPDIVAALTLMTRQ